MSKAEWYEYEDKTPMKPTERNLWRGMDEDGNWHYGELHVNAFGVVFIFGESFVDRSGASSNHFDKVLPHTVGQWTGRYDKCDRDIYDCDLIKDKQGRVYNVLWDNIRSLWWCSLYNDNYGGLYLGRINTDSCEVIGTIFDEKGGHQ